MNIIFKFRYTSIYRNQLSQLGLYPHLLTEYYRLILIYPSYVLCTSYHCRQAVPFLSFYSSIFVLSIFIFSSYMCKQQCLVWHIFPKCRIPWQSRTESTTSRLHTNHSKQTPTRSPGNNHCFAFAANSFLLRLL